MTTNRLSTLGLRSVLIAVVFAGGASVAVADSEWVYVKEGVAGKGCYSKQYRQYQQYPCFFPVRKEKRGCTETHKVQWLGVAPTVEGRVDGTLHRFSVKGEAEVVEKLLNAGANPNAANSYGYVALHVAAWAGHTAIVEALLNAGADPNVVPSEALDSEWTLKYCAGMTPLHFAAHGGRAEIIDALLAAGADANAADGTGIAPLHWADKAGHVDAVVSLLTGGATP